MLSDVVTQPSVVLAPVLAAFTQAPLTTPLSIGGVRTSIGLTARVLRLVAKSRGVERKRML